MFSFLKNHPFAVEAYFKNSFVLTFAVQKEELQHLIPECLALDTFNNQWAFIAMAMVETKELRPKGFPKMFGNDFFLIGYRIFVTYTNNAGKRLRGLYILKSETDKKKMELLGNIFTQYSYRTTDINRLEKNGILRIHSTQSDFDIKINVNTKEALLPSNSPFSNWKEARRFAGPLPFTFTYNAKTKKVLIIEGVRQNWQPTSIEVVQHDISFLCSLNLKEVHLANAFVIQNVPYHWKKGRTEQWQQ